MARPPIYILILLGTILASPVLLTPGCIRLSPWMRPKLPDLGPIMQSVRIDTVEVALAIEKDDLTAGIEASKRLSGLQLAPGEPLPGGLKTQVELFRNEAGALSAALEADDRGLARARFDTLLTRCDSCHRMYRFELSPTPWQKPDHGDSQHPGGSLRGLDPIAASN